MWEQVKWAYWRIKINPWQASGFVGSNPAGPSWTFVDSRLLIKLVDERPNSMRSVVPEI